jgi:hypothetical protein
MAAKGKSGMFRGCRAAVVLMLLFSFSMGFKKLQPRQRNADSLRGRHSIRRSFFDAEGV